MDEIRQDININVKEASEERLVFRRFPYAPWIAGGVVSLVGVYLFFHLGFGKLGQKLSASNGSIQ